jgi:hypothetical protein
VEAEVGGLEGMVAWGAAMGVAGEGCQEEAGGRRRRWRGLWGGQGGRGRWGRRRGVGPRRRAGAGRRPAVDGRRWAGEVGGAGPGSCRGLSLHPHTHTNSHKHKLNSQQLRAPGRPRGRRGRRLCRRGRRRGRAGAGRRRRGLGRQGCGGRGRRGRRRLWPGGWARRPWGRGRPAVRACECVMSAACRPELLKGAGDGGRLMHPAPVAGCRGPARPGGSPSHPA